MIDREHDLSITKQAEVLQISRGSIYHLPRPMRLGRAKHAVTAGVVKRLSTKRCELLHNRAMQCWVVTLECAPWTHCDV